MTEPYDVIIVGAGLAGLACAKTLQAADKRIRLIEASGRIGGRLRTDQIDGFHLDHGFQVMLTSYPTAADLLDFSALNLGSFIPGARIYGQGKYQTIIDPIRHPASAFKTLKANVGTLRDKLKILSLRRTLDAAKPSPQTSQQTTRSFLESFGFSPRLINRFFTPFYGGVFLEANLDTCATVFTYTFDRFSKGLATIPEGGMASIPRQLGRDLHDGTVSLNTPVIKIEEGVVHTPDQRLEADQIVLATPFHITNNLLGRPTIRRWKSNTCLYFSTQTPPITEPILALNGAADGLVNLVCVPSIITSGLAPNTHDLVCVSLREGMPDVNPQTILAELVPWFGDDVHQWRHLKTYHIEQALPESRPEDLHTTDESTQSDRIHICGDHVNMATIEHALRSGVETAHHIIGTT